MRLLDALCIVYNVSENSSDKIIVKVYYSYDSTKFDVGATS